MPRASRAAGQLAVLRLQDNVGTQTTSRMATDEPLPRIDSISVRIRQVVVRDAYISVPISDELMVSHPDGSFRLDGERVFSKAIELSSSPSEFWTVESESVEVHPIQQPEPPGRRALDPRG